MSADIDIEVLEALNRKRGEWRSISERAKVSHSWISQFCRGRIPNPGLATLRRIREALAEEAQAVGARL